jgi:hypothetical protein
LKLKYWTNHIGASMLPYLVCFGKLDENENQTIY